MKIVVASIARGEPSWAAAAAKDYARRLAPWGGVEELVLKPSRASDADVAKADEAARLLKQVRDRDVLIALDERGDALTSHAFSEFVDRARAGGGGRLVFALGGPFGHDPVVRRRAQRTLRLSTLVMNHQIARIVLIEQLYRAMTLAQGRPYHH